MKRTLFLLFTVIFLVSSGLPAAAQKFLPKTIQFKGAPEYSDQELLAAAGLKKGMALSADEMKSHSQKLMDTGVFESVLFKFDGVDLTYTVVPSSALYLVRLENLPLTPGKELDAALHDRFPLYHGKVPSEGGMLDGVRGALEEMLAAREIKAAVAATPYANQKLHQETSMSFAITAPQVEVGEIRPEAPTAALDPQATEILAKMTGSPFNTEGSSKQIETYLGNYYRDKGYLEAEVHATPQNDPVIAPEAIRIPFLLSVSPGPLYKLAGVQLAPGFLVAQADFDRQSHIHPGDIADGQHVTDNWVFLSSQYHNKGYLKAAIHPVPSFDRAQGTVSFIVTAEPGPVYTMGNLTIQNGADDLRAAMLAAWKLPAGAVFNEGAVLSYYTLQGTTTPLGRTFASANCKYKLTLNDDTHTVDVVLRLEKRP